MVRTLILLLLQVIPFSLLHAQFRETFADGEFSHNPCWIGDTSRWFITPDGRLQSDCAEAYSSYYISAVDSIAGPSQWEFSISLDFNPSSANYIDVFLSASDSALSAPATTGYLVRIGNTEDDVCLYRKDSGSLIRIIDGLNGILNSSSNHLMIKVTRNQSGQWELWRKIFGSSFYKEGAVTDSAYPAGDHFGIFIRQSTSGFFNKHFFDDISIGDIIPDTTRPRLLSVIVTADSLLDLQFSEQLSPEGISDTGKYHVDQSVGAPIEVVLDSLTPSVIHARFPHSFPARVPLHLSLSDIMDLNGNVMIPDTMEFFRYTPASFDLVIDEIMADPAPSVGLPDAEWIEIRNRSGIPVNLSGWRLRSRDQISGMMPDRILLPDSFLVITSTGSLPDLSFLPHAISVTSFPYLTNDENMIELLSSGNLPVHSVHYKTSWYQNAVKQEGGWTLEMIDPDNPCSGADNWRASNDPSGGTPGRVNSIANMNPDRSPPILLQALGADSLHVILNFSESLDSMAAANPSNYRIANGGPDILSASPVSPVFEQVILETAGMDRHTMYELYATGIRDCAGNAVSQQIFFGRKEMPDSNDIIINEILFDPRTGGSDYVELMNRSRSIFDMGDLYLAHRNNLGEVTDAVRLFAIERPFHPGQLILITEDTNAVKRDYRVIHPDLMIEASVLPSFPDDTGYVVLMNAAGEIMDELAYSDKWHFGLIDDAEGVALERISPSLPTSDPSNWHSASSDAGYGTPTEKNSQFRPEMSFPASISVEPHVISPDNDGLDDYCSIYYSFPENGNLITITVFDVSGRPVRYLQQGAVGGMKGCFRWDGLDGKGRKLPTGLYIILSEVIHVSGKKRKFKNTVALYSGR